MDSSAPAIIPKTDLNRRRTLILCFDDTTYQLNFETSSVLRFYNMLEKDNHALQVAYYQRGWVTSDSTTFKTDFYSKLSSVLDAISNTGEIPTREVIQGYTFLMQNYRSGDKICFFGFARGAYVARAIAGMIHKIGLLPQENDQQLAFAYQLYRQTDAQGWKQSTMFKKTFSIDVTVEFVGVWDTIVPSGLFTRRLPFTASDTAIRYFRQALSLDERLAQFKATLHGRQPSSSRASPGNYEGQVAMRMTMPWLFDSSTDAEDITYETEVRPYGLESETSVREVWFAGCHMDVGGGSVPETTRHSLAVIPLRWMIRQCFLTSTGIRFCTMRLRDVGLDPHSLYPKVLPRPPAISEMVRRPGVLSRRTSSAADGEKGGKAGVPAVSLNRAMSVDDAPNEEEEELLDALAPSYDMLTLRRSWWISELIPRKVTYQLQNGAWVSMVVVNLGRGRRFPPGPTYMHRSVKTRMEAAGLDYIPKASLGHANVIWVD